MDLEGTERAVIVSNLRQTGISLPGSLMGMPAVSSGGSNTVMYLNPEMLCIGQWEALKPPIGHFATPQKEWE